MLQNSALWDICLIHCRIYEIGSIANNKLYVLCNSLALKTNTIYLKITNISLYHKGTTGDHVDNGISREDMIFSKHNNQICHQISRTRRSENDNTPQLLDQWMDSPFMGHRAISLETVTVSHLPITCPMYLPCTVAQEKVHCASNILCNSYLLHSKSIDLPIPKILPLKIWPGKSKVKVMGQVKVLSHNLVPTSYRLTSFWFHVTLLFLWAFFKSDLQNPRSKS